MVLLLTVLIVPALAQAAPCGAMMSSSKKIEASSQHSGMTHPCQHYEVAPLTQKQGMVLSDCAGLDKALSQHGVEFSKTVKVEVVSFAILAEAAVPQIGVNITSARAPPDIYAQTNYLPSLLLATQRIRL